MYQIYKLTSPSGKFYIGLTKKGLRVRWNNHVTKAFRRPDYNHGLYNAIRKYGPSVFITEVIDEAQSKQEAQKLERRHIAAASKTLLYNVSPGGEADGGIGAKLFWENLNNDPEAKAEYLKRLSDVKKASDWSDYESMSRARDKWRKENPKEAYRIARRNLRIATRNVQPKAPDLRPLKERLLWKHKRWQMHGKNTANFWATCPEEKKADIVERARAKAVAQWQAITDSEQRAQLTEKARNAIDRTKQGKAASGGVKRWWAELKADPVRYAEYIAKRKATLMKTLEAKK